MIFRAERDTGSLNTHLAVSYRLSDMILPIDQIIVALCSSAMQCKALSILAGLGIHIHKSMCCLVTFTMQLSRSEIFSSFLLLWLYKMYQPTGRAVILTIVCILTICSTVGINRSLRRLEQLFNCPQRAAIVLRVWNEHCKASDIFQSFAQGHIHLYI